MVYVSQPTELGTAYSQAELAALSQVCRRHGLPLFVDGARLGYALPPEVSDLTLPALAELADVFYIGGTKCGALFGEAAVITNQFDTLFTGNLYQTICHGAIAHARRIRQAFEGRGIAFYGASATNQQFPILPEAQAAYFIREFGFAAYWPAENGRQIVRYCTSWATTESDVETLLHAIQHL